RMTIAVASVTDLCLAAKAAARPLAAAPSAVKDAALRAIADALEARTDEILEANARDLEAGRESGLSTALMDRLALTPERAWARGSSCTPRCSGRAGATGPRPCSCAPRSPGRSCRPP